MGAAPADRGLVLAGVGFLVLERRLLQQSLVATSRELLGVLRGVGFAAEVVAGDLPDEPVERLLRVLWVEGVHERRRAVLLQAEAQQLRQAHVLQHPVGVVSLLQQPRHLRDESPWDFPVVLEQLDGLLQPVEDALRLVVPLQSLFILDLALDASELHRKCRRPLSPHNRVRHVQIVVVLSPRVFSI